MRPRSCGELLFVSFSQLLKLTCFFCFQIYKITQVDPTTFNLTLTSQHPALFVWLQAIGIKGTFRQS